MWRIWIDSLAADKDQGETKKTKGRKIPPSSSFLLGFLSAAVSPLFLSYYKLESLCIDLPLNFEHNARLPNRDCSAVVRGTSMRISQRHSLATSAALLLASLCAGCAGTTAAQHLISSKAGFVNRVDGKVYIVRQNSQDGQDSEDGTKGVAALGTQMREGDRLTGEAGSYAEILLNPGSYLRIDGKSEVRAVNTDLAQVRFELISGSAMVEVGQVDKKSPIEVITPHGSFFIRKSGLQRIDVKDGMTSVAVRQGEIHLGTLDQVLAQESFKIGRGKVAQLTGAPVPSLAKIDKDAIDEFDQWSFSRAELLMAANQRALHQSSARNGALAFGWHFDPFHRCYTFIPRGSYWSPYGFGFFNSYSSCYDCYFPSMGYSYGNYGGGTRKSTAGSGTRRSTAAPRVVSGVDRGSVRSVIERTRINSGDGGFNAGGRDFGRSPSASPSSSSPRSGASSSGGGASRSSGSARPPSMGGSRGGGGGPSMPSRPRN
jgi:FecR protein